jgi:hypothetical protein
MLNETEHLLIVLSEECAEVAHRVSKALRFGMVEVQPGQSKSNAERVTDELTDLLAVAEMLVERGVLPPHGNPMHMNQKREKVQAFMRYAADCGALR